uniref:Uncharacterized protein n=1 Tax=Ditylenchus dipsaci TaxID=166011 RepID=A0A915DIB5_9BILA
MFRERLRHTYQYLAGGLALTAASGVACARSPFVLSLACSSHCYLCAFGEILEYGLGPLAMGLGLVFVSSIGTFFFTPGTALGAGLHSIVLYGGLILFSAFILYETQRIIKLAEIVPESRIRLNKFAGD